METRGNPESPPAAVQGLGLRVQGLGFMVFESVYASCGREWRGQEPDDAQNPSKTMSPVSPKPSTPNPIIPKPSKS